MALKRKRKTAAMLAAYRANGRKSKGPVTGRGKAISRLNAAKNWGRAEVMRDLMGTLGESPAEFNQHRQRLYESLGPRDSFEALIVDDMAEINWRLRRKIRGETAAAASQRLERKIAREEREANQDAGKLHEVEPYVMSTLGLAGLHDSPPKFFRILEVLKAFGEFVREEGFKGEGITYLKVVYGQNASLRGASLMGAFKACRDERERGGGEPGLADPAAMSAACADFVHNLNCEIAWFEQRAQADRDHRAELQVPRTDAELLNSDIDAGRVALCEDRLERQFDRKLKLLMSYRASQGGRHSRDGGNPCGN